MGESTEVKIARMEEKLDNVSQHMVDLKEAFKDHIQWEEKKYKELENRIDERDKIYATKDMLKWTGGVILGVVTVVFTVLQFIKL